MIIVSNKLQLEEERKKKETVEECARNVSEIALKRTDSCSLIVNNIGIKNNADYELPQSCVVELLSGKEADIEMAREDIVLCCVTA